MLFGMLCMLMGPLAATAQTNAVAAPLRARQLIGMKVEDSDGQTAGTIRNLVLNMSTGKLRYAVIGTGGFFGVNATLKLAPAEVVSAATTKRDTLAIHTTSSQWRNAPVFKNSGLAEIADHEHASEISHYFRVSTAKPSNGMGKTLQKTGRDSDRQPAELRFATDLMGRKVVNGKQEKIGEVLDLLVSFGEPHPAFVVLSTGRLFHREHQYAVPLSAFKHSDGKLVLDADAATLQQAVPFDQAAWKSGGTNSLHPFYQYSTPGE